MEENLKLEEEPAIAAAEESVHAEHESEVGSSTICRNQKSQDTVKLFPESDRVTQLDWISFMHQPNALNPEASEWTSSSRHVAIAYGQHPQYSPLYTTDLEFSNTQCPKLLTSTKCRRFFTSAECGELFAGRLTL